MSPNFRDEFRLVSQISLGWSISPSHPSGLREVARHLHHMAQNLVQTAHPNDVDVRMMHFMFREVCAQTHAHECCCTESASWPEDCPLYQLSGRTALKQKSSQ
jgi:hypothetical protein